MASFSRMSVTIDYNSFEITRDPGAMTSREELLFAPIDPTSNVRVGEYRIEGIIDGCGAQANVYRAMAHGQPYAVKIYRKGFTPSEEVLRVLSANECPFIAPLVSFGRYKGDYWYEVFPYYTSGTLDDMIKRDGVCSPVFIEKKLLPAMDEAIHYLHNKGLVHADLKPANIFISNDGDKVVLGDFGVAGLLPSKGGFVSFRGTLEYAPNVPHSGNQVKIDGAYDYGALGLVLVKAYTGVSLLAGMSLEERDRAISSIQVPGSIPPKSKALIEGLIRNDAQTRYGHAECRKFLDEGKPLSTYAARRGMRRIASAEGESRRKTFEFGFFDGHMIIADSKETLLEACESHWEGARAAIGASRLESFLRIITGKEDFTSQYIDQYRHRQIDERVFWLCCGLRLETAGASDHTVVYRGERFPSIVQLLDKVDKDPGSSLASILEGRIVPGYLRLFGYGEGVAKAAEDILDSGHPLGTKASMLMAICDSDSHSIHVAGRLIDAVDDLLAEMMLMSPADLMGLAENPSLKPWLHKHGCDFVISEMEAFDER